MLKFSFDERHFVCEYFRFLVVLDFDEKPSVMGLETTFPKLYYTQRPCFPLVSRRHRSDIQDQRSAMNLISSSLIDESGTELA